MTNGPRPVPRRPGGQRAPAAAAAEGSLSFTKRARKGIDHTTDGVVYVHHFRTGWQELVFADHTSAARFAIANRLELARRP